MKSVDEIKEIAKTYMGGPVVSLALKDAIKWIDAYREFLKTLPLPIEVSDMEVARLMEEKFGNPRPD